MALQNREEKADSLTPLSSKLSYEQFDKLLTKHWTRELEKHHNASRITIIKHRARKNRLIKDLEDRKN